MYFRREVIAESYEQPVENHIPDKKNPDVEFLNAPPRFGGLRAFRC
jgi:hypothetical protein